MRRKWNVIILLLQLLFITPALFPTDKECVVLLSDKTYFSKFLHTVDLLTTKGDYHGNICLIIGNDLLNSDLLNHPLIKDNNIIVKHFPDLALSDDFLSIVKKLPSPSLPQKVFRYHKLYLFDTYFKQWDTIFYIDCGMEIYSKIQPILDARQPNKLLAQSDAYPSYVWKLHTQFCKNFSEIYKKLDENFDLTIDYFQTTTMLYDTKIIEQNTFSDLYKLTLEYPISLSHDQGIIALYFTNIVPVWEPLPIRNQDRFFYDFCKRGRTDDFIMIKYPDIN